MHARATNLFLLVAVVITVAALLLHRYIPPKRFNVIPNAHWNIELSGGYTPNEVAASYWIDWEKAHFGCKMDFSPGITNVCLFNVYFGHHFSQGVDLSSYDTLVIDADYRGNAPKLRIFTRNFNPAYSNPEDGNSGKFMSLELLTKEFKDKQPIRINLNEFSVAEWWLYQRELDRKYMPVEYGNITLMGFDFGQYLHNTPELDIKINNIYFEGPRIKEQYWYLGILLFWIVGVVVVLAVRLIELIHRNRAYFQQISDLSSDKEHLKRQSDKYKELSLLDPLTGTLNRLGLEKELELIRNDPTQQQAALIVLDIDHFKRINDRRGHDIGDVILKSIVHLVRENIRQEDVFARWGGEEFILVIPNATPAVASKTAEKIRLAISTYRFLPSKPMQVTSSFGVTLMLQDETFEEAFKRADKALYQAKNQGRNCTVLDPALRKVS